MCRLYLIEILHQTTTRRRRSKNWRALYLIEILHQTTTPDVMQIAPTKLYLIEILHQTTTNEARSRFGKELYLIEILHQTTTILQMSPVITLLYLIEILHQTTTASASVFAGCALYLIEILHQTTTSTTTEAQCRSCILSKFYIKPQQAARAQNIPGVVSYRNSTSNHNSRSSPSSVVALYLIEILHQTTTSRFCGAFDFRLYLIEILHQTTTVAVMAAASSRCILSKFYIKPQQLPLY